MSDPIQSYDVAILGSGPAGQKAAISAAKAGKRVLIIEREQAAGGACVHHGTIPSKTLREAAITEQRWRTRHWHKGPLDPAESLDVAAVMAPVDRVVRSHQTFITAQLERNRVEIAHGRGRFLEPQLLEISAPSGTRRRVRAPIIVIATGSRPRSPENLPLDHENLFDSDSILALTYLPQSITVLGSGVIASEYASCFTTFGVGVTMIDKWPRPMGFLDPEISDELVKSLTRAGATWMGEEKVVSAAFDGVSEVVTTLASGKQVRSEKLLCALGRVANIDELNLSAVGLAPDERGLLACDEHQCTTAFGVYAVGDVIGPPSLASAAMEQGRRAMMHALGTPLAAYEELIPMGIFTIPEIAGVGLTAAQATKQHGGAMVGRASFGEVARGHIMGHPDGFLKLVADAQGKRVLGAQIIGEGAAELVHLAQMAIIGRADIDIFIEGNFNFPTLAEAYRVAALDIANRRS